MSNDIDSMVSSTTRAKMEMLERQHEANEKRQELAEALSRFVNGASSDEMKELACDMARDHRTLVQQKFKLFLQFAKVLSHANETGNYDLRNEFAVRGSAKIMDLFDNHAEVPFV